MMSTHSSILVKNNIVRPRHTSCLFDDDDEEDDNDDNDDDDDKHTNHDSEQAGRVATETEPRGINLRLVNWRFTCDLITGEVNDNAVADAD